eukprot:m.339199 g.339199  ORF g.339199 m.339199 type:complete len:109 (-) comp18703_c0_seq1:474-800(-)
MMYLQLQVMRKGVVPVHGCPFENKGVVCARIAVACTDELVAVLCDLRPAHAKQTHKVKRIRRNRGNWKKSHGSRLKNSLRGTGRSPRRAWECLRNCCPRCPLRFACKW